MMSNTLLRFSMVFLFQASLIWHHVFMFLPPLPIINISINHSHFISPLFYTYSNFLPSFLLYFTVPHTFPWTPHGLCITCSKVMIIPSKSCGVPVESPWSPHGVPVESSWSPWSPHRVPVESLWSPHRVPMESLWSPRGVPMESSWSP